MALDQDKKTRRGPKSGLFRRLWRRRDGAAAIEFAILCLPFFLIVFASIETFIAFSAEQLLANATEVTARKIRTGEIRSTMSPQDFRRAFCAEIAILMPCSEEEIATPNKLFLDVRSFAKFSDIPPAVPRVSSDPYADLKTSDFRFAPGGKKTINIVRAYYRWNIVTDLVRPYITNIRPADGSKQTYLMISTAVIQNEDYP